MQSIKKNGDYFEGKRTEQDIMKKNKTNNKKIPQSHESSKRN